MTNAQPTRNVTGVSDGVKAVLLLAEGEIKLMAENPERVMEEIQFRATQVGSVLEGILMERGHPEWGLNE